MLPILALLFGLWAYARTSAKLQREAQRGLDQVKESN